MSSSLLSPLVFYFVRFSFAFYTNTLHFIFLLYMQKIFAIKIFDPKSENFNPHGPKMSSKSPIVPMYDFEHAYFKIRERRTLKIHVITLRIVDDKYKCVCQNVYIYHKL